MTQQELKAEIKHLRWMQTHSKCMSCRIRLAERIGQRELHLRDRIKFDYLIADLTKRGIAVRVVKRFENQNQGLE